MSKVSSMQILVGKNFHRDVCTCECECDLKEEEMKNKERMKSLRILKEEEENTEIAIIRS